MDCSTPNECKFLTCVVSERDRSLVYVDNECCITTWLCEFRADNWCHEISSFRCNFSGWTLGFVGSHPVYNTMLLHKKLCRVILWNPWLFLKHYHCCYGQRHSLFTQFEDKLQKLVFNRLWNRNTALTKTLCLCIALLLHLLHMLLPQGILGVVEASHAALWLIPFSSRLLTFRVKHNFSCIVKRLLFIAWHRFLPKSTELSSLSGIAELSCIIPSAADLFYGATSGVQSWILARSNGILVSRFKKSAEDMHHCLKNLYIPCNLTSAFYGRQRYVVPSCIFWEDFYWNALLFIHVFWIPCVTNSIHCGLNLYCTLVNSMWQSAWHSFMYADWYIV